MRWLHKTPAIQQHMQYSSTRNTQAHAVQQHRAHARVCHRCCVTDRHNIEANGRAGPLVTKSRSSAPAKVVHPSYHPSCQHTTPPACIPSLHPSSFHAIPPRVHAASGPAFSAERGTRKNKIVLRGIRRTYNRIHRAPKIDVRW